MRADRFNAAQYARWRGPLQPNAADNPFVVSDPVPRGFKWRILFASLMGATLSAQALWLYAIPPYLAKRISNSLPGAFWSEVLNKNAGGTVDVVPLNGGVQISSGGAVGANGEVVTTGRINGLPQNSVNGMTPFRDAFKAFTLPPEWALLGIEDTPGAGGSFPFLILDVMFVALPA